MARNLYSYQSENIRRTRALFVVFFAFMMIIGYVLSRAYGDPDYMIFMFIFSVVYSVISYYFSASIALSLAHAKEVERSDNRTLWNIVENLCITVGLPMPKVYITPEMQINAFATGRNNETAVIAVTAGALERLDKNELEAVIAHELSHIKNRDILVSTVAAVLAGIISLLTDIFLRSVFYTGKSRDGRDRDGGDQMFFIFAVILSILAPIGTMLIKLAISRRRESLADASGVLLTRYPQGLISALQKIAADNTPMASARDSTSHLWIDDPFKGSQISWWHSLIMTHPPIEERIAALKSLS